MAKISERLKILEGLCEEERAIMERKASDYATEDDCNKNLKACEAFGVASAEQGVLVRVSDKLCRLGNLMVRRQEARVEESVKDTIMDIRNYMAILYHLWLEKNSKSVP